VQLKGSDLVQEVSQRTSLPVDQAKPMVEVFFTTVKEALQNGRRVEFRGFGSFVVRDYRPCSRRDPRTGETVLVGPRQKAIFKPSRLLINRLNSGSSLSGDDDSNSESR